MSISELIAVHVDTANQLHYLGYHEDAEEQEAIVKALKKRLENEHAN